MEKVYEKPIAELIEFKYSENVVASGNCCCPYWDNSAYDRTSLID